MVIHAAYFPIIVSFRLLPAPPEDKNLESAPLHFAASAALITEVAKGEGSVSYVACDLFDAQV